MIRKVCVVLVVCLVVFTGCQKQTFPQYGNAQQTNKSSSLNPNENQESYRQARAPREDRWFFGLFRKKQKTSWGDQLIAEYEQRMKRNAKKAKKREKEMEKPQYSNPFYFGHKKPPKKRPPHKMKFCKVCKIRH